MAEHFELIDRFADLRAGDTVLLVACRQCGKNHRGTLGEIVRDAPSVILPTEQVTATDAFPLEPRVHVDRSSARLGLVVTRVQVGQQRIFRALQPFTGSCAALCPCCQKPCSGKHINQIHGVDPDDHWGGAKW